ncbi:MAG: Hpt domain-containing protein [Candidatus Omnitrophica bacterium]|nr:Hpt domain-containing protein [Candidatus Omnitrophota bacterium]
MAMDTVKLKEYLDIDVTDIAGELKLKESVYERILNISVMTTSASLPQLDGALKSNDHDSAAKIAHEIKGVFANLRVKTLSDLMAEVDVRARRKDAVATIAPLVAEFQAKFDQLKSVL